MDSVNPDNCHICDKKFGVFNSKYTCPECALPVCKNDSKEISGKRMCTTCILKQKQQSQTPVVEVKKVVEIPTIKSLSEALLISIFRFLPFVSMTNVFLTCKAFSKLSKSSTYWKSVYKEHWNKPKKPEGETVQKIGWKKKCVIEWNWDHGKNNLSTLKGHKASVSALQFRGNTLVSASFDQTIKIWDVEKRESISTIGGNSNTVKCVVFNETKNLVIGTVDNTIKFWSFDGKLTNTLKIHSAEITGLQYIPEKDVIVSSSNDKTIQVTDINTMKTIKTLAGHLHKINCFQVRKDMIVVGGGNEISLWDLQQEEKINTLKGHTDLVRCVSFDNKMVISGSDDSTLKIFEGENSEFTLQGHKGKVNCLQFNTNRLVSGSADSTIKIWDLTSKSCIQTLKSEPTTPVISSPTSNANSNSWVRCLQFDESGKLISGHSDGLIRIWDFS